ncbi:hypothetical protein ACV1D9_20360 [Aeromonas allosaccharophila]
MQKLQHLIWILLCWLQSGLARYMGLPASAFNRMLPSAKHLRRIAMKLRAQRRARRLGHA